MLDYQERIAALEKRRQTIRRLAAIASVFVQAVTCPHIRGQVATRKLGVRKTVDGSNGDRLRRP